MAGDAERADKVAVVEALVAACAQSGVRAFISSDALRTVLGLEYRDLVAGDTVKLQVVWDLLEAQEGFDAAAAGPPLCLFKSWEAKLGLKVELPGALAPLSPVERTQLAAQCKVPATLLAEVLARPAERRRRPRTTAMDPPPGAAASPARRAKPAAAEWTPRRRTIAGAAAVVALLGFGYAGLRLVSALGGGPEWRDIPAAEFAGDLPIRDAERLGNQVGATLTDPGWLRRPRDERTAQLTAALGRLRKHDVRVLFLLDDQRAVRASAQYAGSPPAVRVSFR